MDPEQRADNRRRILAHIAQHETEGGVLRIGALAEALGVDPQHTVVEVERLIEGGCIAGTLQKALTGGNPGPWYLTDPRLTDRGVREVESHEPSTLPAEHLHVLEVIYATFRRVGSWPSVEYVDRVLDQEGIDLLQVLPEISETLLIRPSVAYGAVPHGNLIVTLRGLTLCAGAAEDLERLLCALKLCVDRERTAPALAPNATVAVTVSAADVLTACQPDSRPWEPGASTRVFWLLQGLQSIWSSCSNATDAGWSMTLTRGIRAYRGVTTLEDVLGIQEQQAAPPPNPLGTVRRRSATTAPSVIPMGGTAAPPVPPPSPPSVFILMPFQEPWSNDTHARIEAACDELKAEWPTLQWRRADQIAKPGRITDQIVEAIRDSTVILADITGSNPNVMFEVGFARALEKPLVLLNQNPDNSPFDLRDFRQIAYAPGTPAKTLDDLQQMLRNVLHDGASRRAPQPSVGALRTSP